MSLTDLMSGAGLSGYAVVALILFFGVVPRARGLGLVAQPQGVVERSCTDPAR